MEKTFEQVQAENAKLNERLKNAIQVFKQQKEELARLTTERDSYKAQVAEKDTVISGLEARITEAGSNDQKFFEQLEEIDNLSTKLQETETILEETKKSLEEANDAINDDNATIDEMSRTIESNNSTIASLRKQVSDRNADIKGITDAMIKLAASGKKIADKVEKGEIA